MSVKLQFNTDFSKILTSTTFKHTAKVVTSDCTIECSGAILAQHSSVILDILEKDDELCLDNYTHVDECLRLLHGATVDLNMDNVLDIMKFSVEFSFGGIYQQCLDWLKSQVNLENFMGLFKLCTKIKKCAQYFGKELVEDIYVHLNTFLKAVGPTNDRIMKGLDEEESESKTEFILFLVGNDALFSDSVEGITNLVCEENASRILLELSKKVDALKSLTQNEMGSLLDTLENFIDEENHQKMLIKVKLDVFPHHKDLFNCIPNAQEFVVDGILDKKLWKTLDFSQMIDAQGLFQKPLHHFYYSEMIYFWVVANKPGEEDFLKLLSRVMPYKLTRHYISSLNEKYVKLGYTQPFSELTVDNCTSEVHHVYLTYHRFVDGSSRKRLQSKVHYSPSELCACPSHKDTGTNITLSVEKYPLFLGHTYNVVPQYHDCPASDPLPADSTTKFGFYWPAGEKDFCMFDTKQIYETDWQHGRRFKRLEIIRFK